eukprot:gene7453-10163_t
MSKQQSVEYIEKQNRKRELLDLIDNTNTYDSNKIKDWSIELNEINKRYSWIEDIISRTQENIDYLTLALSENDNVAVDDCDTLLTELESHYTKMEELDSFDHEIDDFNCFIQIIAGAGGADACDWARILMNMYQKWADCNGYKIEIIEENRETDGSFKSFGIRQVTLQLNGSYCYGRMRAEAGVHRLVRKSPFDPTDKRHTSFAQVLVFPISSEDDKSANDVTLQRSDLRIDTFKSSGPGGQSVNTTDSAVRITHIPTGMVVTCQNERSQHANKKIAMNIMKAKIWQLQNEKREDMKKQSVLGAGDNSWGNQIRSVVMDPYRMVKDHRSGWETGDVNGFLSGEKGLLNDAIHNTLIYLKNKTQQQ